MKKILLVLMTLSLLACSKVENPEVRSFSVSASVWYQSDKYPVEKEFTAYYFEGIDVNNGYTAQPGGILINDETGDVINFDRKFIVKNGTVNINNVPKDIHTVIIDMSNTFRQNIDIVKLGVVAWNAGTEYYREGEGVELTFDISPFTPSSVYQ